LFGPEIGKVKLYLKVMVTVQRTGARKQAPAIGAAILNALGFLGLGITLAILASLLLSQVVTPGNQPVCRQRCRNWERCCMAPVSAKAPVMSN
jgi:hypothetical protein